MTELRKLRSGVKASEFPSTPLLFAQKTTKRNNILVGYDPAQERFAEKFLKAQSVLKDRVHDEDLLGQENLLIRIENSQHLELSPQVRIQTGVWSLSALEKGSAGLFAIVRQACTLLGMKYTQDLVEKIADQLAQEPVYDVVAAVWQAVWLLTGPEPKPFKRWPEPWSSRDWVPRDIDPSLRLHALYRDLVALVFAYENDWPAAQKFRISPSKFNVLKSIAKSLDLNRMYQSIKELNKWRQQKYNPYVAALRITTIWQS